MGKKIFYFIKEVFFNWVLIIFVILDVIGLIQEKWTGFKISFGYLIFSGLSISLMRIIHKKDKRIAELSENKEKEIKPNVELYRFKYKNFNRYLLKLHNTGQEDIKEFKITFECLIDSKIESKVLKQYHNENEDIGLCRSHECVYLKKGEIKIIKGIPLYSDNGKINFIVKGFGVKNGTRLNKKIVLNNEIKK